MLENAHMPKPAPPPPPLPAPADALPDLRQRLSLYLKTTDPDVIAAAESAYRGVWDSAHAYIVNQIAEHLPPFLDWLLTTCDPDELRRGYEAGKLVIWTIDLPQGACLVFESLRDDVGFS